MKDNLLRLLVLFLPVVSILSFAPRNRAHLFQIPEPAHYQATFPRQVTHVSTPRPTFSSFFRSHAASMTANGPANVNVVFNYPLKALSRVAKGQPWAKYFDPPFYFKDKKKWDLYSQNAKATKLIGRGFFSDVFLGKDLKNNKTVALKLFRKKNQVGLNGISSSAEMVNTEVHILQLLPKNPYICQFRRAFETETNIFIILDYCGAQTMYRRVMQGSALSEKKAKKYFKNMVLGTQALHKSGIYQVDIKLTNMLISPTDTIKLIDFGLAKTTDKPQFSILGAEGYFSPEMIAKTGFIPSQNDAWSLGVCLYMMVYKKYPFGQGRSAWKRLAVLDYTIPPSASPGLQDLLKRLLTFAPKRATIGEILKHPWLR